MRGRLIITLCGSTKFKEFFLYMQKHLTLQNHIVISVGLFGHADNIKLRRHEKEMLDDMHKEKIDISNAIYVIDIGGYIGESTRREIEYARKMGKKIYYFSKQDLL